MPTEFVELLHRADQADPAAADMLFAMLYNELHRLAEYHLQRRVAGERMAHMLGQHPACRVSRRDFDLIDVAAAAHLVRLTSKSTPDPDRQH